MKTALALIDMLQNRDMKRSAASKPDELPLTYLVVVTTLLHFLLLLLLLFLFLLIHRSIIWICVMNRVRPSGWPSVLACSKLQIWTLHANFSANFCHTCHTYCTIDFYHFTVLSLTLILVGVLKVSIDKSYRLHFGFIFLHTYQLIRINLNTILKQFSLNIPILFF